MFEKSESKYMKAIEYLSKTVELITPEYARKFHQKRYDRLKTFFDDRKVILESSLTEREKTIQLNAAVSALTGAAFSNIEEFNYFVENFEPNNFENDYLAFARNRVTYEMNMEENESLKIKVIPKQYWLMHFLHVFVAFVFAFVFVAVLHKIDQICKVFKNDLNISESVTSIGVWAVAIIAILTVIKIIYEWMCWNDFNKLIKKKYS